MTCRIPFNRACLTGKEYEYVAEAVRRGHISGDGPYTEKCQEFLRAEIGAPVVLTTSCSDALELSALLLNVESGDEAIIPSFTFVSTANAFVLRGARPVFADIRPDTLNLDEGRLGELITPRTKAIVPVHYAGVGCEMDAILAAAAPSAIAVVEDNAHGLFGRYRGRPLGSFGVLATQSFHETKNITCGEGGALAINDARYVPRAEILREKGTNRGRFFRGEVDKYTWVDVGSSFLPSEILAAFLWAQLEAFAKIQEQRRRVWTCYDRLMRELIRSYPIRIPYVPEHCDQPYHMYYVLLDTPERRQTLIAELKSHGILAVFHYLPLHLSEMGVRLGGRKGQCPVSEAVSERILRLPFYPEITEGEQVEVVSTIRNVFDHKGGKDATLP